MPASSEKHYFCTLFDSGYLAKGIAMINSLKSNCSNSHIYVLCMDSFVQEMLEQFTPGGVTCIPLVDIETPELIAAKSTRGTGEYCWTLSPCLPWYILQAFPQVDFITYLDADLFFYSSVQPIFDEIGNNSIAIIEHRFTPRLVGREVNGRFCVQWVSIRRDEEGLKCLSLWRDQCIEWCFYRLEADRMGDQKYLDKWPNLYPSCHIIQHLGAGVAPWNYAQYKFEIDHNSNIFVDGCRLIFYHFHQLQMLKNGRFNRLSSFYTSEQPVPDMIYLRYEVMLTKVLSDMRNIRPSFDKGLKSSISVDLRRLVQKYLPRWIRHLAHKFFGY
jgi:hypothetical protein